VYTGTHDNDTTRGWFESAPASERGHALDYLASNGGRIAEELMRLALQSTALTAILPLQDVLDLGTEARMNVPGATEGNWAWRVLPGQLDPRHARCLAQLTRTYGRSQTDQ
jgi:4-alpha-glucanotransferase